MLPKWQKFPLETVLDTLIDYRGKTPVKQSFGVPLITAKIVKNGRIEEPNEFISEEDYKSWMNRGYPNIGDVIITTEAPVGEVAQLTNNYVALAQRVILLRGKTKQLDNTYLKYCLMTDFVQSQIHARGSGTTVFGIKQSELRKIEILVPPVYEQKSIAKILSSFDDKIELNRKMNATLEQIAQAIFKSWFVDFDPVKAKAAGREPEGMDAETAALFPSEFEQSELGMIPKGWKIGVLKDCCLKVESGGTPSRKELPYWNKGSIMWLTSSEVRNPIVLNTKEYISEEGLKNSNAKLWPSGTTVVAMYGATAGEVCLLAISLTANQACCGLIPKQAFRCFLFLQTLSSKYVLSRKAAGSAQQNLNQSLVANFGIVIPSKEIVEIFEQKVATLIDKWVDNERQNVLLIDLRDTLLPKLISGQLQII